MRFLLTKGRMGRWALALLAAGVLVLPGVGATRLAAQSYRQTQTDRPRRSSPTPRRSERPTPPPRPARPVAPLPPPVTPAFPASQPSGDEELHHYAYRVFLKDGRQFDCDLEETAESYRLIKKAGTVTVAKSEVDHIETTAGGTTRPSTQPATQPTTQAT